MGEVLRAQPGSFLAAMPDMLDPNFMHGVVLVCEHVEAGAHGLMINRPTEFRLGDLFPEHEHLAESEFPVHLGGPVDHTTLQFVHRLPDAIPGGRNLAGELWLGGEFEALAELVVRDPGRALRGVRVSLGYSGWGAGQLDHELGTGSWIPALGSPQVVFGPDGEPAWRRVVRSIGAAGEDLENHPPDVSWN